jgi:vanillate O-demethylase ferredoxin subunit
MTARLIMKMNVVDVRRDTDTVSVFTFRHPWRAHLPVPDPGAHVDLHLPDGKIRQYSLCGDPEDDSVYRIAVKRDTDGRGASRWIHECLHIGSVAHVSAPRNNFPLSADARCHIFVAGGIGVTPFVAMARAAQGRGHEFILHYCVRSLVEAPLLGELRSICGQDRLMLAVSNDATSARFDAAKVLANTPKSGTAVYCCGPQRLIDAVRVASASWPSETVHFEVFKPMLDENFTPEPFDVRISSTGEVLRVPANRSALDVLRAHGFALPSSCELGVCGACQCGYRDGIVIHRDSVLQVADRQDRMMLCVSRAHGSVTLDL